MLLELSPAEEALIEALWHSFFAALNLSPDGATVSNDTRLMAADWASEHGGALIAGIDGTTLADINQLVDMGIEQGWTVNELQARLVNETDGVFSNARALMIARTETAYAFNQSDVLRWRADGIELVDVSDGIEDDPCEEANASTWTTEDALAHSLAHPNCQRYFTPVEPEEAASREVTRPHEDELGED